MRAFGSVPINLSEARAMSTKLCNGVLPDPQVVKGLDRETLLQVLSDPGSPVSGPRSLVPGPRSRVHCLDLPAMVWGLINV